MTQLPYTDQTERDKAGKAMHELAADLYRICRSITGNGLRRTLQILGSYIPLRISEIPTGTQVFDWVIPKEWNISDAYIADKQGRRFVDFRTSNLHVVNYSSPLRSLLRFDEVRGHLHTDPMHPDWIPYRTSYYKSDWGFCLSHNQMLTLDEHAQYEVCIDSSLQDGFLSLGECYIPGETEEEVLISSHICHPSLANDNLSGIVVAAYLARYLLSQKLRYSYRFVFAPGTIGAVAWLFHNQERLSKIRHGLVLTCLGDTGNFHYKKSRRDSAEIDRAAALALKHLGGKASIIPFTPYGYDERQYCSPGFNLPIGRLTRSLPGSFPEYHTSADNLEFIGENQLAESLEVCSAIVDVLERNRRYLNLNPFCEPQLGRRDLYTSVGGVPIGDEINARLWVLNLSDGLHSLIDIAEQSDLPFQLIADTAGLLCRSGLLVAISEERTEIEAKSALQSSGM